jgi:hypothetical protein
MVDIKLIESEGALTDTRREEYGKLKHAGLILQRQASIREMKGHWHDVTPVLKGTAVTTPKI